MSSLLFVGFRNMDALMTDERRDRKMSARDSVMAIGCSGVTVPGLSSSYHDGLSVVVVVSLSSRRRLASFWRRTSRPRLWQYQRTNKRTIQASITVSACQKEQ